MDALFYLSAERSCNHTVVAWTGEIHHVPRNEENHPPVLPSSTTISLGGSTASGAAKSRDVYVSRDDQQRLERQLGEDKICMLPVWLADETDMTAEGIELRDQSKWRRYAEHDLCALLHYQQHPPTDPYMEAERWANYYRMNQLFAERVLECYQPGDIVLVHDYYLTLLPQLLRQRYPDMRIGFYLHTPFPSNELIRCLSRRREILEGMLGSDLIAFQSFHYALHFANTCARVLGLEATSEAVNTEARRVQIEVIAVGINVSNIHSLAWKASVTEKCSSLRKQHRGRKIIVAHDPKDRLGGVDKKLLAFDRFLASYPEYQNKVVLLQIMSQTTIEEDDNEEAKYATKVNELVTEINCKYGSLDYMPIQLHSQSLSTDEYFALMRSGDVALFTSVRDGMCTSSLEYVVCQQNAHGPTMLSEFSGTASSLKEAIHINPWDVVGVADQIYNALNMSEEDRQTMHAALYGRITEHDVEYWISTLLRRLRRAVGWQTPNYVAVPGLPIISEKDTI
ncbi:threalose-6-phosphate phosphatase [Metarhizium rileyi]|uniref:Threalose-6-phosphate phosphatase n=1 Tax=Metarhizium rileyi (strain RCEF 4871) TaxID=1649241 RepID=A0A5C6GMX0_METRR|nr:threalose-6-phosphate phosphatase [Metarhizium rileyi]